MSILILFVKGLAFLSETDMYTFRFLYFLFQKPMTVIKNLLDFIAMSVNVYFLDPSLFQ